MTEEQLTEQVQQLADRIEAPLPSADRDIARGRARIRRRRTAAAGLGAGVAGVLATTALVVTVSNLGGGSPAPVAKDPATAVSPSAAPTPKAPPSRCLEDDATPGYGGDPMPPQIISYRTILAERLDPGGTHLQRRPDNIQGGGGGVDARCPAGMSWATSLGTKLGWRVPGERGLGMVRVEVSDESWRDSQIAMSYDTWQPRSVTLPGVRAARVATYDGGTAVIVTRTDGISVAIDANTLFGNNSLTPVSGLDLSVDDLLATAADPRFSLE